MREMKIRLKTAFRAWVIILPAVVLFFTSCSKEERGYTTLWYKSCNNINYRLFINGKDRGELPYGVTGFTGNSGGLTLNLEGAYNYEIKSYYQLSTGTAWFTVNKGSIEVLSDTVFYQSLLH